MTAQTVYSLVVFAIFLVALIAVSGFAGAFLHARISNKSIPFVPPPVFDDDGKQIDTEEDKPKKRPKAWGA